MYNVLKYTRTIFHCHRKRILKRMTSETDNLSEDIMELENTEESISTIQGLIQTLEAKHG